MEIRLRPKRWGNSLAFIIPKFIVEANRIKENEEITIEIKERPTAKDLFGMLKRWDKTGQQIKDEMRKGW